MRVQFKLARRKIKRFFTSSQFRTVVLRQYGRSFCIASAALLLCVGALIGAGAALGGRSVEQKLTSRLQYDAAYDTSVPYFRTLDAIGSSNHLGVTVKTAPATHKDRTVGLQEGGVNLVLHFSDGSKVERSLTRKFNFNCFAPGSEQSFVVTLPFGYTPFDITKTELAIVMGAEGWDDWSCEWANVTFLMGDKRVLIARSDWKENKRFGAANGQVRAAELADCRTDNTTYQQMRLLFDRLLTLATAGMENFADGKLKADTLTSLGLSNANALYLDVETVSADRNTAIKEKSKGLPEQEDLNYNGLLSVTLHFNARLADGSYTKTELLDIPGKDDFEMASASTFRIELPEGMCVFDINDVSITLTDLEDAWAPRFVRLYLTLDFDMELELARMTDVSLEKQYDTAVFYRGFLDSPISFDLKAQNAIPSIEAAGVEQNYGHKLSDAAYSMYFEKQSYYSRQIRFYEQMAALYK